MAFRILEGHNSGRLFRELGQAGVEGVAADQKHETFAAPRLNQAPRGWHTLPEIDRGANGN